MSKDIYEENKRLKRDLEWERGRNQRLRDELQEKREGIEESMTKFLLALVDGRVLLEQFNGNVPAWRIWIQPKP